MGRHVLVRCKAYIFTLGKHLFDAFFRAPMGDGLNASALSYEAPEILGGLPMNLPVDDIDRKPHDCSLGNHELKVAQVEAYHASAFASAGCFFKYLDIFNIKTLSRTGFSKVRNGEAFKN